MANAFFFIGWILPIIIYKTYSSSLTCTAGHCSFDCATNHCKQIVCTDTADSCTVHCGESNCDESIFYLSATVNTVECTGSDSCKSAQFYCGAPDIIPSGFTLNNFNNHINSCVFTLADNAMSDHGFISCKNDIGFCLLQTLSNDDNFKESTFECHASRCVLQCFNEKSCGSETSHFICSSPSCQCIDNNKNICDDYISQKLIDTETTSTPIYYKSTNILDTISSVTPSITSHISTASTHTTLAPTANKKIIAIAATQRPIESSYIYSTWIRREIPPLITSTSHTEISDNDHAIHFEMLFIFSTPIWTMIAIGFCCAMLIFCTCSVMMCRKRYKQKKKSQLQNAGRNMSSNVRNDKASTIDLAVVDFEPNIVYVPDIEVHIDGLYDVNLDDDETSDDETIPGDGNPYDTIAEAVAALCNTQSVQNDSGSVHKKLVLSPQLTTFIPSWHMDDESDDEFEDMYTEHDGCDTTYGYNTTTYAPYLSQSSVGSGISLPPESIELN